MQFQMEIENPRKRCRAELALDDDLGNSQGRVYAAKRARQCAANLDTNAPPLTDASGFNAAVTVKAFLEAGHSVRETTRTKASTNALADALKEYAGQLEFVEVPDMTVEGTFDNAVKVAHLASPVALTFDDPEGVIQTAIAGEH
ncbi:hypothetical protein B0T26DRAFT_755132 [Lasiosphaeria miniovina]|uniref:Uncharacterized protein n=1 Tax=Lasiosphaeria miniovina TaxID=1954250 RepID=A0AA40A6F0_9PEZI|nr:uncharacterized protein B0T26DRAFT_755132 [Lasiosphaeria miniovina]KAK0710011.1 hypothetical protein B0T26DRAFT_755132 [Lasiosphaeria miniovina]